MQFPTARFLAAAIGILFAGCASRSLPRYEKPIARSQFQTVRTTAYTHSESDHRQYGQRNALGSVHATAALTSNEVTKARRTATAWTPRKPRTRHSCSLPDAMTREGLQDELLRLVREQGLTVLFVTHDLEEALYLGDRVLALRTGPTADRPSLAALVDVNLPRPRNQLSTREHPEFMRLRRALYQHLGSH